eukprot:Skav216854  [mRNA]  locus=scaffold1042:57481:59909:- [translate_table: standard]
MEVGTLELAQRLSRLTEVFIFLSGIAAIWGVVFPFEVVGDDMLQREFGYSPNNAGFIIAAAPMVSIFSPALVPFLGSTLHQKLLAFRLGLATLTIAFLVIGIFRLAIFGVVLVGFGYAVAVSASYSCLPMVIAASAPDDDHQRHKKFEKLAVGMNMANSGFTMIVSNLTIGVIKDRLRMLTWRDLGPSVLVCYGHSCHGETCNSNFA